MTSISTTTGASQFSFFPGAFNEAPSVASPSTRSLTNVGALAFVPPGEPGGGAALLRAFQAVAQQKGPAAAIQWILNAKTAGPLQAMINTGPGRMALAAAALGFTAGWAAGANAPRLQALATALKAVFDQHLSPAQAAQQVTQVLRAAAQSGKAATSVAPDRTAANRQVQPLTTSLKDAQADLKVTRQLLKLRPGDQDLQINSKGQTARVLALQNKLIALRRGRTAQPTPSSTKLPAPKPVADPNLKPVNTVRRLPNKPEELSPWLQDQVRKGMPFEKAVQITKDEWDRRDNMPEATLPPEPPRSCAATVNIYNSYFKSRGWIQTHSLIAVDLVGSVDTASVKLNVKVTDPSTNEIIGSEPSVEVRGRSWGTVLFSDMNWRTEDHRFQRSPRVKTDASCKFVDGSVMRAVVVQTTINR